MSMHYHIKQWLVQEYFSKRSDFSGKRQKLDSFVFTVLQTHIKIKSLYEYKSVWPSG